MLEQVKYKLRIIDREYIKDAGDNRLDMPLKQYEYYRTPNGVLYCGDCLDIMPLLEPVDMVLCDLPYGTTGMKWDRIIDMGLLWDQYKKIIKDGSPIVLTCAQPFTSKLVISNEDMFRYEWIWDKHIARGMHKAKEQPMRNHETILIFSKKPKHNYYPIMVRRDKSVTVRNYIKRDVSGERRGGRYKNNSKTYTYTHKNPVTIIADRWEPNSGKYHPTQKPVTLFEYLIETYTYERESVIDNCIGSGTTAVACERLNRRWIGIEIEEKYCEIAKKRIENERKERRLPGF